MHQKRFGHTLCWVGLSATVDPGCSGGATLQPGEGFWIGEGQSGEERARKGRGESMRDG